MIRNILKELRIRHWIKNLLVLVPLACSGLFFEAQRLLPGIWGGVAFCMFSSAVYIINDIQDIESDMAHPVKCSRPIASGAISRRTAWVIAGCLIALGLVFNCFAFSVFSSALLLLFLFLNIGYSLGLKSIPIVDVVILVSGFLLRVLYGSIVTHIEVSGWLCLTVTSLSFFLALGKRRNELERVQDGATRDVLKFYTKSFLDKNMYMCIGLANVFYALWAMDKGAGGSGLCRYVIWTAPIVLLIFMKYSMDIEGDSDGDPVEVLLGDKVLLALCGAFVLALGALLYL